MTDTAETCRTMVRRGDDWHHRREPCGKKAKGTLTDGTPACGIHLRVESEAARHKAKRDAWETRIKAVNAALGISCSGWDVGRAVSVDLVDLERLAAERVS